MTQIGRRMVLSAGQVRSGAGGFAPGQGAQRAGAGGDELCDPLRVGAGVDAEGPADGLAHEEALVGGVGVDDPGP